MLTQIDPNIILGNSVTPKPTNVPRGTFLLETDTELMYGFDGFTWMPTNSLQAGTDYRLTAKGGTSRSNIREILKRQSNGSWKLLKGAELDQEVSLSAKIDLDIEDGFVMEVDTSVTGTGTVTGTNQIQLTGAEGSYSAEAYQNDILIATFPNLTGQQTLTLPSAGVYQIRILPQGATPFNRIQYNNSGDRLKVKKILNWGNNVFWTNFQNAFFGCAITIIGQNAIKNCQNVASFAGAFGSNLLTTLPDNIFINAFAATNYSSCFRNNLLTSVPSTLFINSPLVTTFALVFEINQLISIPSGFFLNNILATNFSNAFRNNFSLNVPFDLFQTNTLGNNFTNCFQICNIPTSQYSDLLINLNTFNPNNNVTFHGGNSTYTGAAAIAARASLVARGWVITDGGPV
jgi:hypothetical protein